MKRKKKNQKKKKKEEMNGLISGVCHANWKETVWRSDVNLFCCFFCRSCSLRLGHQLRSVEASTETDTDLAVLSARREITNHTKPISLAKGSAKQTGWTGWLQNVEGDRTFVSLSFWFWVIRTVTPAERPVLVLQNVSTGPPGPWLHCFRYQSHRDVFSTKNLYKYFSAPIK